MRLGSIRRRPARLLIKLSLDVGDGEFVVLITAAPDVIVRVDPRGAPKSGDNVELHVAENSMLLFERESGARMRES